MRLFEKLTDEKNNIILTTFLFIALLALFTSCVLMTFNVFTETTYSFILYITGIIGLILITITVLSNNYKFNKCDIIILLLFIFGIISVAFAVNPFQAVFGSNRKEGMISLISYYVLFIIPSLITEKKYKKILIYLIVCFGIISSIFGILQIGDRKGIIMDSWIYARGFFKNSNLFASFIVMCCGISLGSFIFSNKKFLIVPMMLTTLGVILTGAMLGLVAYIVMILIIVIYIIYLKFKKLKTGILLKNLAICLFAFVISYIFVTNIALGDYKRDIKKTLGEINSIVKDKNFDESFGTERFFIWNQTLRRVPKYLIHGVGPDSFVYMFDKPLVLPQKNKVIDKAHNEYLQILVTEGIFTLLIYLALLFLIFISTIKFIIKDNKYSEKSFEISLFLAFMGYLAQAFFNVSVITVAPVFYIIMGLLYKRLDEKV